MQCDVEQTTKPFCLLACSYARLIGFSFGSLHALRCCGCEFVEPYHEPYCAYIDHCLEIQTCWKLLICVELRVQDNVDVRLQTTQFLSVSAKAVTSVCLQQSCSACPKQTNYNYCITQHLGTIVQYLYKPFHVVVAHGSLLRTPIYMYQYNAIPSLQTTDFVPDSVTRFVCHTLIFETQEEHHISTSERRPPHKCYAYPPSRLTKSRPIFLRLASMCALHLCAEVSYASADAG